MYLLDKLSKINDFTLNKVEPARIDGDKMPYEKPLVVPALGPEAFATESSLSSPTNMSPCSRHERTWI